KGCKGVANLCFLPYGALVYKDGTREEYHYDLNELCRYPFGEWFTVKVRFEQSRVLIFVNGREYGFPNGENLVADNLFLSGGMQPVNGWEFIPVSCTLKNGIQPDLFEKRKETGFKEEYLGEVKLPFAIGTEKNRDKILILRRKFQAVAKRVYTLEVDSLDPGGYVAVNGKTVIRKDDFSPFRTDITGYVVPGENELELGVFPRAPEVLYSWHRHSDCYNGWLCQGASVRESGIFIRDAFRVVTHKTREKVDFSVEWNLPGQENFVYRIFLAKIFPQKDGEILLKEGIGCERIDERFLLPLDLWSPETPNLYRVRIELYRNGERIDTEEQETGFRTIEQREGSIYLNGKKIRLKGALNMQFLPPYEEIPVNHLCPDDVQICEQLITLKRMNGNCFRMHQLGYGTSDKRIAQYADRLGMMLIWTTRLIDSVENLRWCPEWHAAPSYILHMQHVINHPSVIMWEGSNEFHASNLAEIDRVYDSFVRYAGGADPTRLLCPVSHLYYGGGIYDYGCKYYNNAGTSDELGNPVDSSFGWKSDRVVRSAHTYSLLLGYGAPWKDMREQNWAFQDELLNAEEKAYLVSEYAVIGRQNPETDEAKTFINKNSYELTDEKASLGFYFSDEEWELSQAYQALCAAVATKQLLVRGADGMLWCCLWGGANNASYLKPIVDFYGYKKFAYYVLKDCFKETVVMNAATDVLFYPGYEILPFVCGTEQGKRYGLTVRIEDENGRTIDVKSYGEFVARGESERDFTAWQPNIVRDGYYTVCFDLEEKER
ncbi:MAG: glycoside hydrolase family 2 TIM barrel-domain containing protein, partial [Candidatus Gallimonas sp.]